MPEYTFYFLKVCIISLILPKNEYAILCLAKSSCFPFSRSVGNKFILHISIWC